MTTGLTRLDLITARDLSFEIICFLQGYAVGIPDTDKTFLIESVKASREQWYSAWGYSGFGDEPAHYALLARLRGFVPMQTNSDAEGWGQRLNMMAHTKLFAYLEHMCYQFLKDMMVLDLAVQEVTGDLTEKCNPVEHQVWHAYALLPGLKVTLRIDRQALKFSISKLEEDRTESRTSLSLGVKNE